MSTETKGGDFAALFEQQKTPARRTKGWAVGQRVEAAVVQITRAAVFVDLDEKRQAWIDPVELLGPNGERAPGHLNRAEQRITVSRTPSPPAPAAALDPHAAH